MAAPQAYFDLLAVTACAMALKLFVIQLLTARCGLGGGGAKQTEDKDFPLRGLFRVALVSFGPFLTPEAYSRLNNQTRNILENEPMFLIIAYIFGTYAYMPIGLTLIKVFFALRILQCIFQLFLPIQPFRAIWWLTSALITVFMAVTVVMAQGELLMPNDADFKRIKGEL
mmetsp:Transcript_29415/g.72600  ORF Transcript_29415/g.72600 Transcript_29415/m.72600 type:complete len:170 (+) Transcript_29415:21-530(+)